MIDNGTLLNYVNGDWARASAAHALDVTNPATGDVIAAAPLSEAADVAAAVAAASRAFDSWRRVPPGERIQPLFRLKTRFEEQFHDIARMVTQEAGKTLAEAEGELRRGIENIEVAAGIPSMMLGANLEDIAPGIDEIMIRQPVGVVGVITPFNFPGMIPLWFLPYAVACGNTVVLKPSEKTPMTLARIVSLIEQVGFPKGVINLVHGGRAAVDALIDHPEVRAISFVGSSGVARYVYSKAAAAGKRAQCQGGAKNPIVVLPDADMDMTTRIAADSAFGCAGQRCLAASVAITVGDAAEAFTSRIADAASSRKVGNGLEAGIEMGPVISTDSVQRIEQLIGAGVSRRRQGDRRWPRRARPGPRARIVRPAHGAGRRRSRPASWRRRKCSVRC